MKDAILTDNARFLEADQEALESGNANDPLLLRYAQPDSLSLWQSGVTKGRAKGLTLAGTERFYNRVVLVVDNTKNPPVATVSACDDKSKAFDKEIATGKVHGTPVTDSSVLDLYGLIKAPDGTWQTVVSTPSQDEKQLKQQCR